MRYIYIFLIIGLLFVFHSCENDSNISVPGYVEISNITLEHERAIGITDAWVFVNGSIQGVYELPAKFPIISEGEVEIKVYPGIKVNGIAASRSYYPFYQIFETNLKLEPGKTHKIFPTSGFESWAEVIVVDDFESSDPKFIRGTTSDTAIVRTEEDKFQGKYAGAIHLDTVRPLFNASTKTFEIPDFEGNYSGMFLEMNFKTDVYVEIGLSNFVDMKSMILLQPTSHWKKIYIDLYNSLIEDTPGNRFFLFFQAMLEEDMDEATVLFDDMKIVHAKPLE